MNANIRRLGAAFLMVFVLISIDLVYWQVIDAGSLNTHVGNQRILASEERVLRGRIYDRNGVLLVGRHVNSDGYVQSIYKDPSLAQTVGYHSIAESYGNSGLQAALNPYLSGASGTSWTQTYNSWLHRPVTGDDVYLTIDERVQQAAVNAIAGVLAQQGLPATTPAAAVAMDPRNGQILATVSEPYFDPTCIDDENSAAAAACFSGIAHTPGSPFVNRVTQGEYPPGSTFKTVTLSAAIDAGIQSLSTEYTGARATGPFTVDGYTIPNTANNLPPGATSASVLQAFTWSDNIVFAQIGLALGQSRFLDYAHRFLLGSRIPFDIPTAISDILTPGENFDRVALASSAFGQGRDHVTPLQMLLIDATIADGGRMPAPILVSSIKAPGGAVVGGDSPGTLANPINGGTAQQLRNAMVSVVYGYYGSGYAAQISGVQVAGKTGTAQTGGPNVDTWFISFAPAAHPTVAVAVVVEGGTEGAYVGAPIAKQIMEAALQYGE